MRDLASHHPRAWQGNRGKGRYGFRYELEVATHYSRNAEYSLKFVSHKTKNLLGKTDLDVVLEDAAGNIIAVQAKRSHAAWGSSKKSRQLDSESQRWTTTFKYNMVGEPCWRSSPTLTSVGCILNNGE